VKFSESSVGFWRVVGYLALSISSAALLYSIVNLAAGHGSPEVLAVGQSAALLAIAAFLAARSR
jgi:hypothetical protein